MAKTRILALFNLKPGVDPAAYEAWAKRVDLPIVNALPSVAGFEVRRVTSSSAGPTPEYQYFEVIDVVDTDQFAKDVATDTMKKVAGEFRAMVDVVFLRSEPLVAEGA